jgi:hypothetical protein
LDKFENPLAVFAQAAARSLETKGKIKWVTLGDANSKFFHSIATVQKRKNHISSLTSISGVSVSDHQSKASLLLEAYKDRL